MSLNVFFSDSICDQLEMELDADPTVSLQHINQAKTLGIDFSDDKQVDAQIYTVAFLKKLLHLREKLDLGFLNEYVLPQVTNMWKEFLRSIENKSQKLLAVSDGTSGIDKVKQSVSGLVDALGKLSGFQILGRLFFTPVIEFFAIGSSVRSD